MDRSIHDEAWCSGGGADGQTSIMSLMLQLFPLGVVGQMPPLCPSLLFWSSLCSHKQPLAFLSGSSFTVLWLNFFVIKLLKKTLCKWQQGGVIAQRSPCRLVSWTAPSCRQQWRAPLLTERMSTSLSLARCSAPCRREEMAPGSLHCLARKAGAVHVTEGQSSRTNKRQIQQTLYF